MRGLAASNFELKDNGVTQPLELVSAEALPLLAVLVFDMSNSVAGERLAALRAASQAFLQSLRAHDEVALFTFADDVKWLTRPTTDKAAVHRALGQLQVAGGTSIVDALYAAVTLPSTQSRTLVVAFTDGEDNLSWLDWEQIRVVAERSNALIHVVGLKPRAAETLFAPGSDSEGRTQVASGAPLEFEHTVALRQIAEATGGRYWEAESPGGLRGAFAAIAEAMGQRYVLRYEPHQVKRLGWHKIQIRLRGHKGDVHARHGYWVADR